MNKVNGRINIKSPNTSALFQMYDKIPANHCVTFRNATEGLWNETPLSQAFFSQGNIQIIQNGIRAGVYHRSNGQYVIGPQDCDSIKIVMRSVFLQHSANKPSNIQEQIELKLIQNQTFNSLFKGNKNEINSDYFIDFSSITKFNFNSMSDLPYKMQVL